VPVENNENNERLQQLDERIKASKQKITSKLDVLNSMASLQKDRFKPVFGSYVVKKEETNFAQAQHKALVVKSHNLRSEVDLT
jgi:hypothetical protein